ncbi:hypothetical protein Kfla_0969 [Kribbella flavida DSM 17836]|uniref:DUF6318 domain-containing protein n=1 Tax=Kribbella flavida (strain DSM 17836 / JCM 10339 / NBRC 14399) TaxID=479435 RepID=D2Q186_KRIFD|nr:DUF6318 family protein [Kribbella flavida]ADB30074.1 hypothetical protein Kfla_0969 [Kribbella flavida DSM 17836]
MTKRNRLTAILSAACLLATLTACTEGSPAAGRPDSTADGTNSTPTTIPTPSSPSVPAATTAPERPAAARGLDLASAEAFYRHYVDLMNYAAKTGQTSELLAASDPGCEGCKEYAGYVSKVNEANGGIRGDYTEKVKEVSELVRGESGRVGGSAVVTVGAYTSRTSPSAEPVVSKAKEYTEEIALSPSDGNWVMYEIQLESR